MRHPKVVEWEQRLKQVFDAIDDHLEEKYGHLYPLHPARPRRGATHDREHDGLFNVGAVFSGGFGSKVGRGYIVEVSIATLSRVPPDVVEQIEEEVVEMLKHELPRAFPGQELDVTRDGHRYKIHGDLRLGRL